MNEAINDDCEKWMKENNRKFSIAVVDPPYGIGEDGSKNHTRGLLAKSKRYIKKGWDNSPPSDEYFKLLFSHSDNQIIWGGNYFKQLGKPFKTPRRKELNNFLSEHPKGWILWDKQNGETDFNDYELAWTSLDIDTLVFPFKWHGMLQKDMKNKERRIHPTQKPKGLYRWLFLPFANPVFLFWTLILEAVLPDWQLGNLDLIFLELKRKKIIFLTKKKDLKLNQ